MNENPYVRWLKVDNDLCLPVIDQTGLNTILGRVLLMLQRARGEGPKPSTCLDLEHLQVANYSAFEGVSEEQKKFIAGLHAQEPVRPEEMIFLALRSLFQFAWPRPTNEADILYAATGEDILNHRLRDKLIHPATRRPTSAKRRW